MNRSALYTVVVLFLSPAFARAETFSCKVGGLIGFGEANELKLSDANKRAAAEDYPVACGLVESEKIIFCLNGELAQSANFLSLTEATLLQQIRTDVNNEWIQADQKTESFFAKFLDGTGNTATGILVSCRRIP